MPIRKAEAEWEGNLAEGSGRLKVGSGRLHEDSRRSLNLAGCNNRSNVTKASVPETASAPRFRSRRALRCELSTESLSSLSCQSIPLSIPVSRQSEM